MAALLVALAVMSVLMTALLPAWRFQARREKELELVFRGEQYVKAIERLFRPRVFFIPEARHHLVNETPEIRAQIFQAIDGELGLSATP